MADDAAGREALSKKAKKKKLGTQSPAVEEAEPEPERKKKRKLGAQSPAAEEVEAEPDRKKKKKASLVTETAEEPGKKKKKQKELESEGTKPEAATDTVGKKKNKKNKKHKKFVSGAGQDAKLPTGDEEDRRNAQREIQQLVLRLRAEGKSKHEIEAAKRDLKLGLGKSFRKPDGARAKKIEAWKQKMATEDGEKKLEEERQKGLERKHDLVVIPVIWRGRHDQQDITKAAEDIKAFLAQQGLDVWVDSRRHYTPGQKFAHWEYRGVMIRIEVGPEDLTAGMLRLCRAKEAGDYQSVEKKRLRLPPRGSRKLLLALKDWGLTQLEIERRAGDDEDSDEEVGTSNNTKTGKAAVKKTQEEEDLTGNWEPRVTEKAEKKKKKKGLVA